MLSTRNIQMSTLVVVVVCIGCCLSIPIARHILDRDPLLAIASDTDEASVPPEAGLARFHQLTGQYNEETGQEDAQKAPGSGEEEQNNRQQVYYVVDPSGQEQAGQSEPTQAQQYYASEGAANEEADPSTISAGYPGEIVYETPDPRNAQNEPNTISGFMEMISKSASLPATILTEVPVNQLPEHVLEKLKREYGVKVLATRESPGANLVINCEDYNGNENSFCQKPSPTDEQAPQEPQHTSPQDTSGETETHSQEYVYERPVEAQSYYQPQQDSPTTGAGPRSDQSSGNEASFGLRNVHDNQPESASPDAGT